MAAPTAFKSKAQMRRFEELVKEGKMRREFFDECYRLTPNIEALPERIHPKKDDKPKASGDHGGEAA